MTPEETAKRIVEEFNGHTFFMESMAQEWLEKRIAEGIRKHIETVNQAPTEPRPNPAEERAVIVEKHEWHGGKHIVSVDRLGPPPPSIKKGRRKNA